MEQVKHGLVHCRKLRYQDTTGRLTYFMHPCSNLIARLWGIELPCASSSPPHTHTHTHAHRTNTLMCKNDEDFLAKLFCIRLAFDELMESQANKNYFTQIGRDIMSSFLRSTNQVFLFLSFLLLLHPCFFPPSLLSCLVFILANLLKSETKRLGTLHFLHCTHRTQHCSVSVMTLWISSWRGGRTGQWPRRSSEIER